MVVDDKYIGLVLAVTSSLAIGTSFVVTKKGLNDAEARHGFEGDGFSYVKSPVWWAGIVTMVGGELFNFSAYAFAPAILVTPLGALSVLIGAVLGSYFLKERLGVLGKIGCSTCLIGSVIIVLHAPPDKSVESVGEILDYALQWPFLIYCALVCAFCGVMIYRIAPRYGKKNPLIYLSICSAAGSVSIMAIKGFGIAVKLTLGGSNQFTNPSTYVFMIITVVCILTQMNYFNKALATFSTNIVNPIYYVTFTTATLAASFILFQGFNTDNAINTISLLCGFLIIFSGVYLLNLSRNDPDGATLLGSANPHRLSLGGFEDAPPTDGIGIIGTRLSMQARRSVEVLNGHRSRTHSRHASGSSTFGTDREGLMRGHERSYDLENGIVQSPRQADARNSFSLGELAETDDEADEADSDGGKGKQRISFEDESGRRRQLNGGASGENGTPLARLSGSGHPRVKRDKVRMGSGGGKGGGGRTS